MKVPDGWVLVPKAIHPDMVMAAARDHVGGYSILGVSDPDMRLALERAIAAAPPPPADPEIEAGKLMDGYAGAVYRLIDRCDYRETQAWMRGEILRQTSQDDIINAAAAAVEAIALQCAGLVTRSQMREFARRILTKAATVLEDDIQAMIAAKKSDTVLHNRIRLVVPGT